MEEGLAKKHETYSLRYQRPNAGETPERLNPFSGSHRRLTPSIGTDHVLKGGSPFVLLWTELYNRQAEMTSVSKLGLKISIPTVSAEVEFVGGRERTSAIISRNRAGTKGLFNTASTGLSTLDTWG